MFGMFLLASVSVKDLKVWVDTMTPAALAPVFSRIRPEWDMESVKVKVFTEGTTNAIAAFFQQSMNDSDAVVVRLNGASTDEFLNRQKEVYFQLTRVTNF